MIRPHQYRHLDKDSKVRIEIDLLEVAKKIDAMNYGVQRFLSHLLDVRRERHAERIKAAEARDPEVAAYIRRTGDELAEGIEKLLQAGLF